MKYPEWDLILKSYIVLQQYMIPCAGILDAVLVI